MSTVAIRPLHYFGLHFLLLRFLGLGWWHHPEEPDKRNFFGWYLYYAILTQLVWVVGFVGLETIDPFIGEKDIDRFMFSLSFVITHDLTLIKLCLFYFRHSEIQDIVHTLEIKMHVYYQNYDKIRATVRASRFLTGGFLFFGWATIMNASVYGAVQDVHWKRDVALLNSSHYPARTLPQPIFIPWNYQKDKSYIPTFVLETIGLLWTGHIVMTIDTFIGSVILHMSSQFAILQEALSTAYHRTMMQLHQGINDDKVSPMKDQENLERYYQAVHTHFSEAEIETALESTLKNCFRQHQELISCVEKLSSTYAYGFLTQLLSSMAAICVVMVQVSQDASSFKSIRLVTSLAFFCAMTIQLAIQCYAGNELTLEINNQMRLQKGERSDPKILFGAAIFYCLMLSIAGILEGDMTPMTPLDPPMVSSLTSYDTHAQAGRVAGAVMQCRWECMSPRLRKLLLIALRRAQKPLRLSAAGFANMDNACFFAIMKAAYSYYAVLSQKQGK